MTSTIFHFQSIVGTKENAGPEFEDPTHSGCRRYQQPLQTSRLPARQIIAEKGTKNTAFRLIAKQWQSKSKKSKSNIDATFRPKMPQNTRQYWTFKNRTQGLTGA